MSAPQPKHAKSGNVASMEVEPELLAEPHRSDADSLISRNDPDDLANEQTWPAEDEMRVVEDAKNVEPLPDAKIGTTPKRVRRLPKGMSEYQAAWIVDDESGEDGGSDEEEECAEDMQEEEVEDALDVPVEEGRNDPLFQDLDMEDENEQSVSPLPSDCTVRHLHAACSAGSNAGEIARGRKRMMLPFPMRWIHRRMSQRRSVSSDTAD
jgi:pre-rRNA-processing protein TSR1